MKFKKINITTTINSLSWEIDLKSDIMKVENPVARTHNNLIFDQQINYEIILKQMNILRIVFISSSQTKKVLLG